MPAGNFEPAGFDWEHRNLKSFLDQQRQVQTRMSALREEQDRVVKSFNTGATVIRRNIGKINTSVSRLKTRSITNYKRSVRSIPETWEDAARRVEAASTRINNAGGFGASFRGGGGTRGRGGGAPSGAAASAGGSASRSSFGANADPRLRVLEELAASREYNPGASAFQRQQAVDQTIRQFEGDNIHRAFRDNLEKVVDELEKYRREIRETRELEERTREQRSALRLQARGAGLSGEQVAAAETRAQSNANLTRESRRLRTELNKDIRAHQRVERAQQKAVDQRRENIRAIARERRELIRKFPEQEKTIRAISRERLEYELLTPARRRARTELTRSLDARRQFGQQGGRLERGLTGLSEKLHRAGRATGGYYTGIGRAAQAGSELIGGLGGVAAAINPVTVGLVAATAAGAAFFGLASRAAAHEGLIDAFQRTGVSLERLREGSKGYVADITLMRQANLALTGTTGMIRTLLRDNLHKFAEIAAAQARDTGQDVTYLYNSLIEGFKRSSPRIIDNTGLVVKLGQANKDLATELGKTTQQLTQQEQQAALLQAILRAGERSVRENADAQETAAQKLQKIGAAITNTFDKIGFALQPLFSQLLEEAYRVIRPLEDAAPKIGQALSSIVQLIVQAGHGFVQLGRAIFGFYSFVFRLGASFLEPVDNSLSDTYNNIENFVRESLFSFNRWLGRVQAGVSQGFGRLPLFVRNALGLTTKEFEDGGEDATYAYIRGFGTGIRIRLPDFLSFLKSDVADNLIPNSPSPRKGPLKDLHIAGFNVGAGYMNEFNSALAQGYNTTYGILNRLSRMLIGRSPPPDGPLRFLDTGGKNAALAWIDAFIGQDLQPFDTVASNVIKAMGRVATFTKEQVTGRLGELDRIQHAYNDQLNITKARFEALKGPADRAIAAIDRNIERRLQDIASGDRAAAAIAREFDLRRDKIYEAVDAQQILIDEAEVQLGLVKAQQAEERVLLNIRKRAFDEARRAAGGAGGPDVPGFTDPGDLVAGERGELPGFRRAQNVFYEAELERLRAYLDAGGRREDLAYFGFSQEVIADYERRQRFYRPPRDDEFYPQDIGPTRGPIRTGRGGIQTERSGIWTVGDLIAPGGGQPRDRSGLRERFLNAPRVHLGRLLMLIQDNNRKIEAEEERAQQSRLAVQQLANTRIINEMREHYSQLTTTQNEELTKQETRQATFSTVNRAHIDDYIERLTGGENSLKASVAAFFGGSSPDSWSYYLNKGAVDTGEFVAQVTAHYNDIIAKARETAQQLRRISFAPSGGGGISFVGPTPVQGFARGGVAGPGFFIAGEEGPELILTQRQLAVIPADVTRELRAFASGVSEYRGPSAPRGGGSSVSNSSQVINNNFVVPDNVDLVRRLRMNGIG